jgi:hypothetical protein
VGVGGRFPVGFVLGDGLVGVRWGHGCVLPHPVDGHLVLRVPPSVERFEEPFVAVVDRRDGSRVVPGSALWDLAGELQGWVAEMVWGDGRGVQEWFGWVEGQFRLVDLFAGYHAVSGGFSLGERHLTGFWGHEKGCGVDPRDPSPQFLEGVL